MAGEIDMMFDGLSAALPHIQEGRVHALAVAGDKRSSLLPELPTVQEAAGFPFNTSGWYGMVAPRGTPPAIVARLHDAIVRALAKPELKDSLAKLGVEPVGSSPEAFARQIREENAAWAKVIKTAGIKAQ
jgi:tripartite-type tricarboxylate transporter receptor subunit TctC